MSISESAIRGHEPPIGVADIENLGTVDVRTAGRLLGLGRDASFAAAKRGEIPVLRFGRRLVVPVPKLLQLIGYDPDARVAPTEDAGANAEIPNLTTGPGEPHHERQPADSTSRRLRAICEPNPGRPPAPEPPAA